MIMIEALFVQALLGDKDRLVPQLCLLFCSGGICQCCLIAPGRKPFLEGKAQHS
jgi:hypothetical protein